MHLRSMEIGACRNVIGLTTTDMSRRGERRKRKSREKHESGDLKNAAIIIAILMLNLASDEAHRIVTTFHEKKYCD